MSFFAGFLYSHRRIIAVILTIIAVLTLFLLLYGVPGAAVVYALLICSAVTVAAAIGDFIRYRKKCRVLSQLEDEILLTLEHLPEPDTESESDYQELLETLFLEKNSLASVADKRYDEASDYFAMWAHQIKTPITAMSLAMQSGDFPEKEEFAEYLQRIEQYVEMALCYVHLDSDESDLVIKAHSLNGIIKQVLRKFSKQFIRRRLTLIYDMPDINVLTDEKLLLFVIEQLISNSLKYTKHGSIEITLETPGEPVLLIRDTGIGIAPEDLPRIFERGFTGQNGRSDKRATGIGLYLCRRICERLGHTLTARSDEHGTEMRIDMRATGLDTRE